MSTADATGEKQQEGCQVSMEANRGAQSSLPTIQPGKVPRNAGEPPLKDSHITPPWGTASKDMFKILQFPGQIGLGGCVL